jgi:hypothetical protein
MYACQNKIWSQSHANLESIVSTYRWLYLVNDCSLLLFEKVYNFFSIER